MVSRGTTLSQVFNLLAYFHLTHPLQSNCVCLGKQLYTSYSNTSQETTLSKHNSACSRSKKKQKQDSSLGAFPH